MKFIKLTIGALLISLTFQNCAKKEEKKDDETPFVEESAGREIWTKEQAKEWYAKQG